LGTLKENLVVHTTAQLTLNLWDGIHVLLMFVDCFILQQKDLIQGCKKKIMIKKHIKHLNQFFIVKSIFSLATLLARVPFTTFPTSLVLSTTHNPVFYQTLWSWQVLICADMLSAVNYTIQSSQNLAVRFCFWYVFTVR